jgi:hypothetical protein
MRYLVFFVFFFSCCVAMCEQPVPVPVYEKDNLAWNKWDTRNFTVLSIDEKQGESLKNEIESLKSSLSLGWGFQDEEFPERCKLMCVSDAAMLKRLFGLDSPRCDAAGTSRSIWIDRDRLDLLPSLVAAACLSEKSPLVKNGVSFLNLPLSELREGISKAGDISISEMLDSGRWSSAQSDARSSMERKSAVVCLMLRRELGRERFVRFLEGAQDGSSIMGLYGFGDLGKFDRTASRYSKNISEDVEKGIVPDKYLRLCQ